MQTFNSRIKIRSELEDVYAALTNPFTIELWTGYKAIMSETPGDLFELWEGDICGHNIAIIPNEKIVQEWYFGETDTPSIVTIKLFKQRNYIQMDVEHTNIPDEAFNEICDGWKNNYLADLKEFMEIEDN